MSGAPVVSVKARPGETVQIDAVPESRNDNKGNKSVTGAAGSAVDVTMAGANQGTFCDAGGKCNDRCKFYKRRRN